jgi:hypothetical protein
MGIKHVEAFSDSLLVMQQVAGVFQCFDGSLNVYLDKYLKIIGLFDDFTIHHVFRDEKYSGEQFGTANIRFSIKSMENRFSRKNQMFRFAKLDALIFSRCAVQ